MASRISRRAPTLRTTVILLMLAGFALVSVPAYWGFNTLVNATIVRLGTLFAEKQILFDRYRGLSALMQEVALAETLTRSPAIAAWAKDESDPAKKSQALAELEQYRQSFSDHSYFFVVDGSGDYYYNDAQNSHAGKQFSFTVSRSNPSDAWYYATRALGGGCHLNVDHDDELNVTKVFVNCVVTDGPTVLGVLGTGIDLTSFIQQVVDFPQAGVQAMFVDPSGAIQAHRDPKLIDFHSLTNAIENKKTIFSLLDLPTDRTALQDMMQAVTKPDVEVRSQFMQIDGRQILVGVGYLDKLGWYNVSFMDVDQIIDKSVFVPIGLLVAAAMIAVALIVALLFKIGVLDRLARVEKGVVAVQEGDPVPAPDPRDDEVGRLSRTIASMASNMQDNMQMLERMVDERTSELHSLAYRDQMTGIANRRGVGEAFDRLQSGAEGESRLAMLLIDIDRFKTINDRYGHQTGDEVVVEVARRIGEVLRPADICGRWGGDEFIVLFSDLGSRPLRAIADAVRRGLSNPVTLKNGRSVPVTVSIGACLVERGERLEQVADMADAALYLAKEEGRDCVVVYDPTRDRSAAGQIAS